MFTRDNVVAARSASLLPSDLVLCQLIGPTTSGAAQTSSDFFRPLSDIVVQISVGGAETVSVALQDDNGSTTAAYSPYDASNGRPLAALVTGTYIFPVKEIGHCRKLIFTKSAGVQTMAIAISGIKEYNP
jgi:hypothetical protein